MNTRGIRNNNPANIRRGCNWRGLSNIQTDRKFCQFIAMVYGVRALLVTLRTYVVKHNLHSLRDVIYRWAPPSDGNNTEKYVEFVEKEVEKVDSSLILSLQAIDFMPKSQYSECLLYLVAKAMCKMESGYNLSYVLYTYAIYLMYQKK